MRIPARTLVDLLMSSAEMIGLVHDAAGAVMMPCGLVGLAAERIRLKTSRGGRSGSCGVWHSSSQSNAEAATWESMS